MSYDEGEPGSVSLALCSVLGLWEEEESPITKKTRAWKKLLCW